MKKGEITVMVSAEEAIRRLKEGNTQYVSTVEFTVEFNV